MGGVSQSRATRPRRKGRPWDAGAVKEYRAPEALILIAADRDQKPLVCPSCGSAAVERTPTSILAEDAPGGPGDPPLQRLLPHCRLHPAHGQPLVAARSPSNPPLTRGLLRRREDPAPSHRREERQRPPAVRVVAEVHDQRPAPHVLPRQEAPVPPVVRAVPVVAHHEERVGGHHDRSPVLEVGLVARRVALRPGGAAATPASWPAGSDPRSGRDRSAPRRAPRPAGRSGTAGPLSIAERIARHADQPLDDLESFLLHRIEDQDVVALAARAPPGRRVWMSGTSAPYSALLTNRKSPISRVFSMLPDGIRNASTRKVRRKNQTTSATAIDLVHSQSQVTREREEPVDGRRPCGGARRA